MHAEQHPGKIAQFDRGLGHPHDHRRTTGATVRARIGQKNSPNPESARPKDEAMIA